MQEWWDWDGIGRYKSRRHGYPVNLMLRLVLGVIKIISNSELCANLCKDLSVKVVVSASKNLMPNMSKLRAWSNFTFTMPLSKT